MRDNVALTAMFGGAELDRQARERDARRWLAFTGLRARADALPGELNLHQTKFLELARALASRRAWCCSTRCCRASRPPRSTRRSTLIRRIREQGTTIVLVEHVMRVVTALPDRIVVLDQGRVLAEGAPPT